MSDDFDINDTAALIRGIEKRAKDHQAWLLTPEGKAHQAEQEKLEAESWAREAARAEEEFERKFAATGTPKRIRDLLKDSIESTQAVTRMRDWERTREEDSWCLVLSADKGTGKSVAAGMWLRMQDVGGYKRTRDGETLRRWWTGSELAVLDWYSGKFGQVAEISGPLVIDDLGAEFTDAKGFFQQRLDALIDARYREYRPTLITTNLSASDFTKRYGQRVVDRIREGGAFYEFNARSMRGAQ